MTLHAPLFDEDDGVNWFSEVIKMIIAYFLHGLYQGNICFITYTDNKWVYSDLIT